MISDPATHAILHASSVAYDGAAVVILGPSGAGKSALALSLMAYGAALIADDQTEITLVQGHPVAGAPKALLGLVEARGIGILAAVPAPPTPVRLVVDLAQTPPARLPPRQDHTLLGVEIDLICGRDAPNLAPAILQYLKGGRVS